MILRGPASEQQCFQSYENLICQPHIVMNSTSIQLSHISMTSSNLSPHLRKLLAILHLLMGCFQNLFWSCSYFATCRMFFTAAVVFYHDIRHFRSLRVCEAAAEFGITGSSEWYIHTAATTTTTTEVL